MTTNHPITPPRDLIERIVDESETCNEMIQRAYAAGADQELEACCEYISQVGQWFAAPEYRVSELRTARRPKPPSLKEQALARTDAILNDPNRALLVEVQETLELNRRALEALDD